VVAGSYSGSSEASVSGPVAVEDPRLLENEGRDVIESLPKDEDSRIRQPQVADASIESVA
jgi:hypothetical protein